MAKVKFTIDGVGPFEADLNSTMEAKLYELRLGNTRADETIFRPGRKIQVIRDGDFDLYGKARNIDLTFSADRHHVSGKITLLAD